MRGEEGGFTAPKQGAPTGAEGSKMKVTYTYNLDGKIAEGTFFTHKAPRNLAEAGKWVADINHYRVCWGYEAPKLVTFRVRKGTGPKGG